jgi:hypothetical protein
MKQIKKNQLHKTLLISLKSKSDQFFAGYGSAVKNETGNQFSGYSCFYGQFGAHFR